MLKQFFIVFICTLFLTACGGPEKPKNLISKKQMVNILIDAKIVASANAVNKKTMEENGVFPDTYLYNKYNIDSLQFAESNAYYTYYVKDYEEIYEMVKDSLEELKAKYKELQETDRKEKEKKHKDSLDAILKKRDSIKFSRVSDSLVLTKINDTLPEGVIPELIESEGKLITPVSEK